MNSISITIQATAGALHAVRNPRNGVARSSCPAPKAEGPCQGAEPQAPRGSPTPASVRPQGLGGASPGYIDLPGPAPYGRDIRFHAEFRRDTGDLVFEVRDYRTGETIRQFPPEALLDAGQETEDLRGLLVNELV